MCESHGLFESTSGTGFHRMKAFPHRHFSPVSLRNRRSAFRIIRRGLGGAFFPWLFALAGASTGVDEILAIADQSGWERTAVHLRQEAFESFEKGEHRAPELYLRYRWARLWGESRKTAVNNWIEAIERSHLGHSNMPRRYALHDEPMARLVSRDFERAVLAHTAFSREFFSTLAPVDHPEEVLKTLNAIHASYPDSFFAYGSLALAVAVVFDVPPPREWPHAQVSEECLQRSWPDPVDAFAYWSELDRLGAAAHPFSALPTEYLKYVVDAAASFEDLDWARAHVRRHPDDFGVVYDRVGYRSQRVERGYFVWPGESYGLAQIEREGGICVDQAYFAAHAGKAHGIPTLIFRGAGLDGRHAWFGYLRGDGSWDFDAGRYGENRYVTGLAYDPQTWANVSDHQLAFLAEGFHQESRYRQSRVYSDFALEYLRAGSFRKAREAAAMAVRLEKRNRAGWEVLHAAVAGLESEPAAAEAILRQAARAFEAYPGLEAIFRERVVQSLIERGQPLLAANERRKLAYKNRLDRADLAVRQAAERMQTSMAGDPVPVQMRVYRGLVLQHASGGGAHLYDGVVRPFIDHLLSGNHRREALQAAEFARLQMDLSEGSQLGLEMDGLIRTLKGG